ncbi:MAG: SIMPL domain-containing protein [Spirochaetaceae bacterium]|jgi:uncharacterized protein YggE|nr:SIMPL domain-containing protein [Spirochaetaceae bacterium]
MSYFRMMIALAILISGCVINKPNTQSTISVTGIGTVMAPPDLVQMNITFSYIAETTKQAKDHVDARMNDILAILAEAGIDSTLIRTISLTYDVATEYSNGRAVRLGQRAQQTITVTIKDIINTPERFPAVLDKLSAIDQVGVSHIKFDTEHKAELFQQSRELAYQKALDKAQHYAHLAGAKITGVVALEEEPNHDAVVTRYANAAYDSAALKRSAVVPAGDQEINTELNVTFALK